MGRRLYVGNLSYNTTEDQVREVFGKHGKVTYAKILFDQELGRSRGFGFVEMSSDAEAAECITQLHQQLLDGRALTVNEARERENRSGGGGGGYNSGGGGGGGGGRRRDGGGRCDRGEDDDRRGGRQYDRRLEDDVLSTKGWLRDRPALRSFHELTIR